MTIYFLYFLIKQRFINIYYYNIQYIIKEEQAEQVSVLQIFLGIDLRGGLFIGMYDLEFGMTLGLDDLSKRLLSLLS